VIFEPPPVYEEEEEEKSSGRVWIVVLLVVIIALLCFGVAYQYKPEWFGKSNPVDTTIIVKGPPPAAIKKGDTVKSGQVAGQDTVAKNVVPIAAPDSLGNKPHFDVIGGSFLNQKEADVSIRNYKSIGVVAKKADMPGKRIKLSLGSYATKEEAEKAKKDLIKAGKAPKDSFTIEIKPKK